MIASRVGCCAVLLVLCSLAFGCGTRSTDLLDYVPRDSVVLVRLDWPSITSNVDLSRAVGAADLRRILRTSGLQDDQIIEVLAFAVLQDGSVEQVVAARTRLRGQALTDLVRARDPPQRAGIVIQRVTGPSTVLVGTVAAIDRSLVAQSARANRLAADPRLAGVERMLRVSAETPVTGLVAIPEQFTGVVDGALDLAATLGGLMQVGPIAQLVARIGVAHAVVVSVGRPSDGWPVAMLAVMRSDESAAMVSGALSIARGAHSLVNRGANLGAMPRDLTVRRSGRRLDIRLVLPSLAPRK